MTTNPANGQVLYFVNEAYVVKYPHIMSEISSQLYRLQQVDLALEKNALEITRFETEFSDDHILKKAHAVFDSAREKLDAVTASQKKLENDITDLEAKIKEIENKMYTGKVTNPKELVNLQKEGNDFRKRLSKLEETDIELMDKAETEKAAFTKAEHLLSEVETRWEKRQSNLEQSIEEAKKQHAELKESYARLSSVIAPDVKNIYSTLRKQKGVAVSMIEKGNCGGCRIALPNSVIQHARGGQVTRCTSCGRILHIS